MSEYPLPAFRFKVDWSGKKLGFSEASGLTAEAQAIEYRHGMMKEPSSVKMPGLRKYNNIVLKRGITPGDNDFYKWFKETIDLRNVERRDITISLLDEKLAPVVIWKVKNAFPVKMEGPGFKATGNEVSIETLELAHEGFTVENKG